MFPRIKTLVFSGLDTKEQKRIMSHPIFISFYHKHSYVRSKNHNQNKLFEHFMVGNKMRQTCELYPLWLLKVIISHLFNYAAWRLQVSTRSLYLFLWGDRRPVVQKWHKGKTYFLKKIGSRKSKNYKIPQNNNKM